MKLVIDNSILNAGGGIQVAISFLNDLKQLNLCDEYHIIQSPNISNQIDINCFPKNFIFYNIPLSEHKNILKRIKYTKKLEKNINPDCIFTTFGPSYHKSKYPKVIGFALPYIIYPNSPFFKQITLKEKLKYKLMSVIKTYCFNKNADALIFESDDARQIFNQKLTRSIRTYTVNNTLNNVFNNYKVKQEVKESKTFNILCLSANYPHKNLAIIPHVIDNIVDANSEIQFKFNISANKSDFNFENHYNQYINYLGRIDLEKLPELYETMDVLFMPTLLEVFSTTYLEAMYMQIPIVCSDMSFARDICADAALYCEPTNPKDYAEKLLRIKVDLSLSNDLINKGIENLKRFGNSMNRTKLYLNIIKDTINANNQK